MYRQASEEIRLQWKENILKQRESGLSIASWCRQNNFADHTFYYWRDKFFPKDLARTDFCELSQQANAPNKKIGFFLEYQGISIHLEKHFDHTVLKQCLKVIKDAKC